MKTENKRNINPLYLIPEELSCDTQDILHEVKRQFNRWLQSLLDDLPVGKRLEFKDKIAETIDWELFYVPDSHYQNYRFQRLSWLALLGAILGGALFTALLGGFFKEAVYGYLVGAPIGAAFFVWLFSWVMRHPKKSTLVQALLGISATGLSVGLAISTVKQKLFPRSKVFLYGWIAAIIGFFLIFVIQFFKPKKEVDTVLRRKVIESQLNCILANVMRIHDEMEKSAFPPEWKPRQEPQMNHITTYVPFSLQQILKAVEAQDADMALTAAGSLVNALGAEGIKPHELERGQRFTAELLDYYEPFGILKTGDSVEVIQTAWVDQKGNAFLKGKLRRISKK